MPKRETVFALLVASFLVQAYPPKDYERYASLRMGTMRPGKDKIISLYHVMRMKQWVELVKQNQESDFSDGPSETSFSGNQSDSSSSDMEYESGWNYGLNTGFQ